MSFMVFFEFSVGFQRTLFFRKGTYERVLLAVNSTERRLGIRREYYDGACRWRHPLVIKVVGDAEYCDAVEQHNRMVRYFYSECDEADVQATERRSEAISPDMAANLFIGLRLLSVTPEMWTRDYYQARMEAIYQTLRGREEEGMTLDSEPLSVKQAEDVIILFSQYLDVHDIRLAVCKGQDSLTNSYSEGYFWCSQCGAVDYDDLPSEFDTDQDVCNECAEKHQRQLFEDTDDE